MADESWRLDQDEIVLLTDVEKETLNVLEKLVATPGWAIVQKWASINADEQLGYLINASSWEQNRLAWAARFVYMQLANFEQVMTSDFKLKALNRKAEIIEKEEEEARELT